MRAQIGLGQADVELAALGDVRVPLVITIAARDARPGLVFELDVAESGGTSRRQEIRFVAPIR